jgi:hypothetical protein
MASQKKAQGGYPQNQAAKDDSYSTTGDGHPPRDKQAKANKSTTETQGARVGSRAAGGGKGAQTPSRQKK